jgi:acetolactate synthase I/II/III large subunit
MSGAHLLMRSLAASGVEICFANPGTSEMHLVAALDQAPGIRPVLTLHENVASGAADGWGRMTGRPASTLLHLGPGLANALANLHNARRAATPMVNVVGEHASYHVANDPPLASDIAALARTLSGWVHTVTNAAEMGTAAARAVAAAEGPPASVATLIVPSDAAWEPVPDGVPVAPPAPRAPAAGRAPDGTAIDAAARALSSGETALILVGGRAMRPDLLAQASRVARATGARLYCTAFTARARRGAGSVAVERLPYFPEMVAQLLAPVRHLVLVDAPPPVAFFAYPGQSVVLVPPSCTVHALAGGGDDVAATLAALADATSATQESPALVPRVDVPPARGPVTPEALAQTLGAVLPEEVIVCDEAITNRIPAMMGTLGARPHDWLCLTGGSLGMGIPLALGAALAAPGRRVLNLQADGSAMYTPQALWSLAREGADVTVVLLKNRRYRILELELHRMQLADASRGRALTDLSAPDIDYMQLAQSMGVPAQRVDTAEGLADAMQRSFAAAGPRLVEVEMAG